MESPWIDPNSSNEASVHQRPQARLAEQYQTIPRPARHAKKSGALLWLILLVLLLALAYLLIYPGIKGGS